MSKQHRKLLDEQKHDEHQHTTPYTGDDSEEGSQLQSTALEEAMGNMENEDE